MDLDGDSLHKQIFWTLCAWIVEYSVQAKVNAIPADAL